MAGMEGLKKGDFSLRAQSRLLLRTATAGTWLQAQSCSLLTWWSGRGQMGN